MKRLAVVALALLAGCATTGQRPSGGGYDAPITRQEIAGKDYETAYDAVLAERRSWLQGRGSPTIELNAYMVVYVNGMRWGTHEELHNIPAAVVKEIRYYDSGEATLRFGTGHPEGAIEVIM